MNSEKSPLRKYSGLFRWGAVVLTLLFFLSLFSLLPVRPQSQIAQILWAVVALGTSALIYALIDQWLHFMQRQEVGQEQLGVNQTQIARLQDRLEVLRKINSTLVDAEDEKSFMLALLSLIGDHIGAKGATYIPVDEWGQPLATVNVGSVPPPLMESWIERLGSPQVQQTCKACEIQNAATGSSCPLGNHPFSNCQGITCLQLKRNDRLLGVLNFYRLTREALEEDTRQFLSSILGEMAFAVETIRLRSQELATLRQLQLVRNPKMELPTLLKTILFDLQQALEADYAFLCIRNGEKNSTQDVEGRQGKAAIDAAVRETIIQQALQQGEVLSLHTGDLIGSPDLQTLIAAPIQGSGAQPLGVILVGSSWLEEFNNLQLRFVATMASQAALFIENDHLVQELEYKTVIDERNRLAREIHDGLAQTLAFLKMQVSQMQNYLAREDLPHLNEVLRTNYSTLSAAYLDVRQAIDNLRVTPDEGLQHWLEQIVADFQNHTGLKVQLSIQEQPVNLSFEIQAQLIRVVQEALNNIRKHAHATRVAISLREWEQDFILEISDNGQGFSAEEIPGISQYGLRGMHERAEMIGADFQIVSQPHQGTTVRLRLPYPFEEAPV